MLFFYGVSIVLEYNGLYTRFLTYRSGNIDDGGPEPMYDKVNSGYQIFHLKEAFKFFGGGQIPELILAYETWGELNKEKDNVILLFTGLSPSSHARSHQVLSDAWPKMFDLSSGTGHLPGNIANFYLDTLLNSLRSWQYCFYRRKPKLFNSLFPSRKTQILVGGRDLSDQDVHWIRINFS